MLTTEQRQNHRDQVQVNAFWAQDACLCLKRPTLQDRKVSAVSILDACYQNTLQYPNLPTKRLLQTYLFKAREAGKKSLRPR